MDIERKHIVFGLMLAAIAPMAGANDQEEAEAMETVADQLKDPGSAQFRNVRTVVHKTEVGGGAYICGEVNAKNAYGGYVGYRHSNE